MATSKLERIIADERGRLKACFGDGSLLLLASNAQFYYAVDIEGRRERHLTRCALRRHSQQLAQVLRFRNLYFRDAFYAAWVMDDEAALRRLSSNWVPAARWPIHLQRATEAGTLSVQNDRVYVFSSDGNYRLVYDAIGERVSVRYPLNVELSEGSGVLLEDKVFTVDNAPSCWREPLQLALNALAKPICLQSAERDDEAELSWSRSSAGTEFRHDSWWFHYTSALPDDAVVVLDWRPDVLYCLNRTSNEVHAWIEVDESALETTHEGQFIQHRRRATRQERIYAHSSVPASVLSERGEVLYALAAIAEHAFALRSAATKRLAKLEPTVTQPSSLSVEIHEERRTREGVFTAFIDGRLRVKFADRTILNLDRSGHTANVVLSHGERLQVPTERPFGVEAFIRAALAFRHWAFSTPEQRAVIQDIHTALDHASMRCRVNAACLLHTVQKQRPL